MLRIKNKKLLYPELSYSICGLCFKVQNSLGRFRSEKQYGDALEELLKENKIPYNREVRLEASFTGERSGRNIVDFIVDDKVILELKAKRLLLKDDYFQVKRYLVSCNKELGILVNFRQKVLTPKRILNKV